MQIKGNNKAPCHWPLWEEFTGDRWIPHTKRPVTSKMFPSCVSSWNTCDIGSLPRIYAWLCVSGLQKSFWIQYLNEVSQYQFPLKFVNIHSSHFKEYFGIHFWSLVDLSWAVPVNCNLTRWYLKILFKHWLYLVEMNESKIFLWKNRVQVYLAKTKNYFICEDEAH